MIGRETVMRYQCFKAIEKEQLFPVGPLVHSPSRAIETGITVFKQVYAALGKGTSWAPENCCMDPDGSWINADEGRLEAGWASPGTRLATLAAEMPPAALSRQVDVISALCAMRHFAR